ncbi:DUF309 domain-containing protein [Paenibacillus aurantius]|uniref:DUF309 domain-containing protein n=1 Tax=Paenibacillus aurantius TaxID=2918900 RepID=A0AA96RDE1_9BACL|nr:DUF309 domain-containing protein [Paenibacillus aurantius]WNQ09717.1 DUF309 domain-containing protein [Paenibacillus aurantius]
MPYDPLYVQFLYHFNVSLDYFECHEVMEELWLEEGRDLLYQGLLQAAVGLYHHRNGNPSGSLKLFTQAADKLERYPRHSLGIDLGELLENCLAYRNRLAGGESFAFYSFPITILDPDLAGLVEEMKRNPPAALEED